MKLLNYFAVFCCSILIGFSQSIELQSFASGFTNPVEIAKTGVISDSRLFIVEQAGIIKILNANGTVNPTPFLNITSLVGSGGERGLLGLAFALDYATSETPGRFYVYYTDKSSTSMPNTFVARYTVSADPDIANTAGATLLTYQQPFGNHNGGKIAFGPDNLLYIGSGDGGSGGDPGDRAQNTSSILGKILRIDVSGATYSIPPTNPFSSSANGVNDPRPEIYAVGLRNPWKFSFDKTNGDLWIADVGQNAFEEINKVSGSGLPGGNYGWRCYEGNNTYNTSGNCPSGGFSATIAPVAEYAHVGSGCSGSVTGGYIYRGNSFPSFAGKYFFADYCKQTIGILTDAGSSWTLAFQTPNITQGWTTFGEDVNGELYIAGGSTIYKIIDPTLGLNLSETFNFKIYPNPSKGSITVDLTSKFNNVEILTIFNLQGQNIKEIIKPNNKLLNISTENYAKGLYFLEIRTKNSSINIKKLMIQ